MKRIPSPSMAVAITALVFALAGSGYAATQLTGGGHTAKAAKKARRGARGPQGLSGPAGQNGAPGTPGAPGGPGAPGAAGVSASSGRINSLNTVAGSINFAAPSGTTTAVEPTQAPVAALAPAIPLTVTSLSVKIDTPPGNNSVRFFGILRNGVDSGACAIVSAATSCSIPLNFALTPLSDYVIYSDVLISDADPAVARFAWTAQ